MKARDVIAISLYLGIIWGATELLMSAAEAGSAQSWVKQHWVDIPKGPCR